MKKVYIILLAPLLLSLLLIASPAALAQTKGGSGNTPSAVLNGTISDGGVSFTLTTDASGGDGFTVGGVDHLWDTWWWYRISGDTAETIFPVPDTENYTGNVATLTWANVNGRGFSATLVATVLDTSGGAGTIGTVQQDLTIINNSGATMDMSIFTYADFDLAGSITNDSMTLNTANNIIDLVEGGTTAQISSNFVTNGSYRVDIFPNVRNALNDAVVDDLANTGLPTINADFTGAFQEGMRTIANGGSITYTSGFAVDTTGGTATAPTAVTLQSISANSTTAILPVVLIAALLLALMGGVVLRRRS